MARQAPDGFDQGTLRTLIEQTYSAVAEDPKRDYHFHRGAEYAVGLLGYDAEQTAAVPQISADRFAGVGNPHRIGPIHEGEVVLDHACGGGFDLLLAARRVGPSGRAIGVDMTAGMCAAAKAGARAAGLSEVVQIHQGVYEQLPLPNASVDVVISNGVLNLAPNKLRVVQEIVRVLKPGGRLHLADVIVQRELKYEVRSNPELWAACIAGALPESEVIPLLQQAGFSKVHLVERFDCFNGTRAVQKVSRDLEVQGATFLARL